MDDRATLTTLLSQVLVAFVIECDNEAERRTREVVAKRIFSVSYPMWANFLRFVDDDGIAVRELQANACVSEPMIRSGLHALSRWRYVEVEPSARDERDRPPYRDWVARPTRLGRFTRKTWRPIVSLVEQRYRERFGDAAIDRLYAALETIVDRLDIALPSFLPILGYDCFARVETTFGAPEKPRDLPTLLSDVLLAYTREFERESKLSLAIGANLLRVLAATATPLRALPTRTGIAKETIAQNLGFLARAGYAIVEPSPGAARGQSVRLTPKGRSVRTTFRKRDASLAGRWERRFGSEAIRGLRSALDHLLDERDGGASRLAAGLVPPAGGWRADKPYLTQTNAILADPRAALPHYPMVTHRGGWPDGS